MRAVFGFAVRVFKWWVLPLACLGLALLAAVSYAPESVRAKLVALAGAANGLPPPLPERSTITERHWLEQNWTGRQRYWFHHASQGTATFPVPYDFFVSLEQPRVTLFDRGRLADIDYLRRFGFIDSPSSRDFVAKAEQFGYSRGGLADPGWPGDVPTNDDGLPVGFARLPGGIDPETGRPYPAQLGFTCAACHTGHIEYRNVSIRFDGGPAMIDLGKLEKATGLAILYTLELPFRLSRFADAVRSRGGEWKTRSDQEIEAELRAALARIGLNLEWTLQVQRRFNWESLDEGFGRLDALNRIGNQVFFENLLPPEALTQAQPGTPNQGPRGRVVPDGLAPNFARLDAPVSFPPIWDTPWFSWAQYDGSIFNELVRNAGEALGVNAKVNMNGRSRNPVFRSSVDMMNIHRFEELLRGPMDGVHARRAFAGLVAPRWSDVADKFKGDAAWSIRADMVDRGRELYRAHCAECHRGPVRDGDLTKTWPTGSFWDADNWIRVGDRQYYKVVEKPVADMGTDPQQALVLTTRQVRLPPELGLDPIAVLNAKGDCGLPASAGPNANFALALMAVVDRTIDQWFEDQRLAGKPVPPELERQMRGPRRNCPNRQTFRVNTIDGRSSITVVPHYRARPLDGVWATAPYLHNGSVPTLDDLLKPQDQRPTRFCVGSRQFDPGKVGLVAEPGDRCPSGLTEFDTRSLANSNRGHSFEGTERDVTRLPSGVIGPAFSEPQRRDLIEYLKTL
ncbi:MAG: cytochrome c [Alphaproteobacteria bacterium]|nr:cytochrome c [Alphaproteobacteria bacterium]MCW5744158.1 cytochrome c [Alphaproteobacteria bacterium]